MAQDQKESNGAVLSPTYKYFEEDDNYTNVSINKTIDGTSVFPRFHYKVVIPKVDNFEFVLALDSSGSLLSTGGKSAILRAVPEFLESIQDNVNYKNKTFKVSIVSWDDDIDFAYGGFSNNNSKNATLESLQKVISDINYSDESGDSNLAKFYKCEEGEYTEFSKPMGAAIDIFEGSKNNKKFDFNRTERFIILVTDKSEFRPCNKSLVDMIRSKSWNIYSIGIQVDEKSNLCNHLLMLSNYSTELYAVQIIPGGNKDELKDDLSRALQLALETAVKDPVATNVTISETLYGYFIPDEKSIRVNGTRGNDAIRWVSNKTNLDKTITFSFELAKGLYPESVTDVTFDAKLNLIGLPLSPPSDFPFTVANKTTPRSCFRYIWFNGQSFNTMLRDNKVNLIASPSTNIIVDTEATKSAEKAEKEKKAEPSGWSFLNFLFNWGGVIS